MQGLGIRQARQLFLTHCCEAAKRNCFHTRLWREGRRDTALSAEGETHWRGVRECCLQGGGGPPLDWGPTSPQANGTPTLRAASPALGGQGRHSQRVEGEAAASSAAWSQLLRPWQGEHRASQSSLHGAKAGSRLTAPVQLPRAGPLCLPVLPGPSLALPDPHIFLLMANYTSCLLGTFCVLSAVLEVFKLY